MRRHLLLTGAMLLIGAGCPSEMGRGGRLDQAMKRDVREAYKANADPCPAGKHWIAPLEPCSDETCAPVCVDDDPDAGD